MTVTVPANPAAPDRPDPEHLAAAGLAEWLREDRAAAEEHEEAMRAGMHQHEMQRRKESADRALDEARARVSGLIDKHNLDGRRTLAFWLGSAIVVCLVILDAIPLNWAAQAFGLNAADSWVVTLILLVASIGAMAALEAARHDARRYMVLVAVTLTAYTGLVALRTSFLVTVAGESTGRRDPASSRAERDLRRPGLPRFGGDGADAIAPALARPGGRSAGATGQPDQRSRLAAGRGQTGAAPGRAAPAVDRAAPVRFGALRNDAP